MPLSPRPGSGPGAALRRGRGPARGAVRGGGRRGVRRRRGVGRRGGGHRGGTRARARSIPRGRAARAGADAVVVGARGECAEGPSEPSDRERGRDEGAARSDARVARGSRLAARGRARARPDGRASRPAAARAFSACTRANQASARKSGVDRGRRSRGGFARAETPRRARVRPTRPRGRLARARDARRCARNGPGGASAGRRGTRAFSSSTACLSFSAEIFCVITVRRSARRSNQASAVAANVRSI